LAITISWYIRNDCSLNLNQHPDSYIEDESGKLDWLATDEEVHMFVGKLLRPVGTYLTVAECRHLP
jgi:hypothetical protein